MNNSRDEAARLPERSGPRVESASRSLLWIPLLLGGVAAAVVASRSKGVSSWMSAIRKKGVNVALQRASKLREAVIGNDKVAVAKILGLPPATVGAPTAQMYFVGNTWYYPLSNAHRVAIAIEFQDDIAKSAQVLHVH